MGEDSICKEFRDDDDFNNRVFRFLFSSAPFPDFSIKQRRDWNEIRFTSFRHWRREHFPFQFCFRWFTPSRLQKERREAKESESSSFVSKPSLWLLFSHKGATKGKNSRRMSWDNARMASAECKYVAGWKICLPRICSTNARVMWERGKPMRGALSREASRVTKAENDDKRSKALAIVPAVSRITFPYQPLNFPWNFCSCAFSLQKLRRESHK